MQKLQSQFVDIDSITLSIMQASHFDEVACLIADAFTHSEPLLVALGGSQSRDQFLEFVNAGRKSWLD